MAASVRVLVVDRHAETGSSIATALGPLDGFCVIGVAHSVRRAGELAEEAPDVALVDARMSDGGGAAATREILAASARTRILGHAPADGLETAIEMLQAGASGYIVRGAPIAELAGALRAAARGERPLDASTAGSLVGELIEHLARAGRPDQELDAKRARVKEAFRPNALQVAYQPIFDLFEDEVVGYEALARFACEPRRTPDLWFAEADEVGLGVELELEAVRVACRHADTLPPAAYLAVNVSPAAATSPDLPDILEAAPVDDIVLEVTEHAPVSDYRRFQRDLRPVRDVGARLAVDDAGAGFASLRHILELDAELIKLDPSLTHDLDTDRGRRSLASALIGFGREMSVSILAEGIESASQADELRRLGVRYGQGFHLGRPRPVEAAVGRLSG